MSSTAADDDMGEGALNLSPDPMGQGFSTAQQFQFVNSPLTKFLTPKPTARPVSLSFCQPVVRGVELTGSATGIPDSAAARVAIGGAGCGSETSTVR